MVGRRTVLVGNAGFLSEHAIDVSSLSSAADALATDGKTPVFVARDGVLLGIIGVADTVKPTAVEAAQTFARGPACLSSY